MSAKKRAKLETVITKDFMSSEDESELADGSMVFIIRPLQWRSEKLTESFRIFDEEFKRNQDKSWYQTVKRQQGHASLRPRPATAPSFVLQTTAEKEN